MLPSHLLTSLTAVIYEQDQDSFKITRYVNYYLKNSFFFLNTECLEIVIEKLEKLEELKIEKIKELENLELNKIEELKRKRIEIENMEKIAIEILERKEIEKKKNSQFNKQIIYYPKRNTFTTYLRYIVY